MPALVGLAQALGALREDELARRRWDEALARIEVGQGDALDELPVVYRSAAEVYARTGDAARAVALRAKAEAVVGPPASVEPRAAMMPRR